MGYKDATWYTVDWYNEGAPALDADNLNRIENGIQKSMDILDSDSVISGRLNETDDSTKEEIINGQAVIGSFNAIFGVGNKLQKATQFIVAGTRNQIGNGDKEIFQGAVFGSDNSLKEDCSQGLVSGRNNEASHSNVTLVGNNLCSTSKDQFICGKYNNKDVSDSLIAVGIGGSETSRSNGFRVSSNGTVYTATGAVASGADYAEYFEWEDGNINNEKRIGRFITISESTGKIRYATEKDDFIIGILSSMASVIGNSAEEEWHGKFLKDVYGRYILDSNGDRMLNPEYDNTKTYTPRSERPEWAVVGLLGQIIMDDDGTCVVGKFCYPSKDGIATLSEKGYKVLERVDATHIKVLFR